MVTGTVKPHLFDVLVLHKVITEIADKTCCSFEQYQVEKIFRDRRVYCDEHHIVARLPKKLLEQ